MSSTRTTASTAYTGETRRRAQKYTGIATRLISTAFIAFTIEYVLSIEPGEPGG